VGWLNDGVFHARVSAKGRRYAVRGTYNGLSRSRDAGCIGRAGMRAGRANSGILDRLRPPQSDVMYACSKNGENEGVGRPGFHARDEKPRRRGALAAATTGLNVEQEFYKIIVDRQDPDTLYLATQFEGVWISRDASRHWAPGTKG